MADYSNPRFTAAIIRAHHLAGNVAAIAESLAGYSTEDLAHWLEDRTVRHNGCHEFGDIRARHINACAIKNVKAEIARREDAAEIALDAGVVAVEAS